MKKVILLTLMLILAPIIAVSAAPDSAVIRLVPVGEPHTGMAIMTESPTQLEISVTNEPHSPTYNVSLIFLIDEDTYDALNTITITNTDWPTTLTKASFTGGPVSSGKLPEASDTNWVGPYSWPGCSAPNNQYEVSAILSQMSQVYPTTAVRYMIVYAFDSITTSPKLFDVEADSTHINVLILAQGRLTNPEGLLTERSPYTGSTLVVFELGPLVLALASFSALALYALKRRKC